MKKPKNKRFKPKRPYLLVTRQGTDYAEYRTLRLARADRRRYEKLYPSDAPHRIVRLSGEYVK